MPVGYRIPKKTLAAAPALAGPAVDRPSPYQRSAAAPALAKPAVDRPSPYQRNAAAPALAKRPAGPVVLDRRARRQSCQRSEAAEARRPAGPVVPPWSAEAAARWEYHNCQMDLLQRLVDLCQPGRS